jgi:hypothetical protein
MTRDARWWLTPEEAERMELASMLIGEAIAKRLRARQPPPQNETPPAE